MTLGLAAYIGRIYEKKNKSWKIREKEKSISVLWGFWW